MTGARAALSGLLAPLLLGGVAPPGGAPKVAARTLLELPRPLPAPYRASADAKADIAAATARARQSGKPLLLVFGANWCASCRLLAGVLALPEMRSWVPRHFELVDIDIGQFSKNVELGSLYGVPRIRAVPTVLVIDAKSGTLRNRGRETELAELPTRPQAAADWLAAWQ